MHAVPLVSLFSRFYFSISFSFVFLPSSFLFLSFRFFFLNFLRHRTGGVGIPRRVPEQHRLEAHDLTQAGCQERP